RRAVPADGQGATAAPRLLLRRLRALRRAGTGLAAAPGRHDVDAPVRGGGAAPGGDPPGAAWGRAALQWRPPGADRGERFASVRAVPAERPGRGLPTVRAGRRRGLSRLDHRDHHLPRRSAAGSVVRSAHWSPGRRPALNRRAGPWDSLKVAMSFGLPRRTTSNRPSRRHRHGNLERDAAGVGSAAWTLGEIRSRAEEVATRWQPMWRSTGSPCGTTNAATVIRWCCCT